MPIELRNGVVALLSPADPTDGRALVRLIEIVGDAREHPHVNVVPIDVGRVEVDQNPFALNAPQAQLTELACRAGALEHRSGVVSPTPGAGRLAPALVGGGGGDLVARYATQDEL